ncbi:frequency clock protein [Fusarium oxysporum]|nr:frequency clock protein [Fusarium oxysporum]
MPSNQSSSHRTPPSPLPPPAHNSLRRNSPSSNFETGSNDPLKWLNDLTHNVIANCGIMDINVPSGKEPDSSNMEKSYSDSQYQPGPPMPITTHTKEELKHHKKLGPATLHEDKLFEIKIQGLPLQKKRELEAILRDFATDLKEFPDASSSQKKKTASPHSHDHIYSKCGIGYKHAPSSPGTNLGPTDSAYVSFLPIMSSTKSSNSQAEDYLRDVPDGLYPQHMTMTDKERKSLVVRRLEQLFTGGTNGADISKVPLVRPGGSFMADLSTTYELPTHGTKPIQEASIPHFKQQSRPQGNKCNPRGCEAGGNNSGSASKQRPIRPCDLDPDRTHMPRLPPESSPEQQSTQDVYLDTEGWLHLINVTSDFLQLSPDGQKIGWRGGSKHTKLSSCSPSYDSQACSFTDDIDGSEKKRKGQKTTRFTTNKSQPGGSSKDMPQFDPQLCARNSSARHTSLDLTVWSLTAVDDDNPGEGDLGLDYSRGSAVRSQHHEGAISYYSGAPFCIDLSGDPATITRLPRCPRRTASGSFIGYRPLTDLCQNLHQQTSAMGEDNDEAQGSINNGSEQTSDIDLDLVWNDNQQYMGQQPLFPCGLSGVLPADHFTVVVNTKRPKQDILPCASKPQTERLNENIERMIHQRAVMLTCPVPGGSEAKTIEESPHIEIEYLSWCIKRLVPVPLPSPVSFFPPFSTDNSTYGEDDDPSIAADSTGSSEEDMS